jgi:hypothetical protein
MKWEELIAEARAAGVLKFCAEGIAVLQQVPTHAAKKENRPAGPGHDQQLPGRDREQGRESGHRPGESADQSAGA